MRLWLTNFAYTDDDEVLHLDVPRMLRHMGVEDTYENRDKLTKIATEHLQAMLKDTKAVIKITE
jgi:hypothetical protein